MGYRTYVSGNISIEPPLNALELAEIQVQRPTERYLESDRWPFMTNHYSSRQDYPSDIAILVSTERFINDDGDEVTRVNGVAIVSTYTDSYKAYNIKEDLQELINRIAKLPTPHTFAHHLNGEGEERPDMWRLKVKNGKVVKITPEIVWPKEDTDDPA